MSAIHRLAGFLQLANGFIEQAHFAEGDAKVVMGFRILFRGGGAGFEIVFEVPEHFREINASVLAKGGSLRSAGYARNDRRNLRPGRGMRCCCTTGAAACDETVGPPAAAAAAALAAAGALTGGADADTGQCGAGAEATGASTWVEWTRSLGNGCSLEKVFTQGSFKIGDKLAHRLGLGHSETSRLGVPDGLKFLLNFLRLDTVMWCGCVRRTALDARLGLVRNRAR